MVIYYDGVVIMVEDLLVQLGLVYDLVLFEFVNDIVNDQIVEIECMNDLFVGFLIDLCGGLVVGFCDVGEVIFNLILVVLLLKLFGFFDLNNLVGLVFVIL